MVLGLIVGVTVLAGLVIVAAAGYYIDASVPENGEEVVSV